MTFPGHVQDGLIVPEAPLGLANGAKVEIHVLPLAEDGLPEVNPLMKWAGCVDDLPPDASQRIDEVLYGVKCE